MWINKDRVGHGVDRVSVQLTTSRLSRFHVLLDKGQHKSIKPVLHPTSFPGEEAAAAAAVRAMAMDHLETQPVEIQAEPAPPEPKGIISPEHSAAKKRSTYQKQVEDPEKKDNFTESEEARSQNYYASMFMCDLILNQNAKARFTYHHFYGERAHFMFHCHMAV